MQNTLWMLLSIFNYRYHCKSAAVLVCSLFAKTVLAVFCPCSTSVFHAYKYAVNLFTERQFCLGLEDSLGRVLPVSDRSV